MKTLSAPTITLANGQLGYITVATQIDYVATYSVDQNTLVPEIDTVSDAVQLMVRPVVSADLKYVFLELSPTILQTDLSNTVSYTTFVGQPGGGGTTGGGASGAAVQNFFTLPRINQQTLETTVGVPDRGVLIVGGLTTSERRHHEGGVPILDKIPLIKRIFSAEGRKISRDRLFVMARPQIIIIGEEEKSMR
jgi:type II secretory pathway component GspD/PulD (secretin)